MAKVIHYRWLNHNIRRKRRMFTVTKEILQDNGFSTPVFDYFSYIPYKNLIDELMLHCKNKGLTKVSIIEHWYHTTNMKKPDIKSVLAGSKVLETWELLMLFEAFGVKMKLNFITDENYLESKYKSEIQESSQGTKLLLRSTGYISFLLVINLDDFQDWTCIFKKGIVPPAVFKYRKEVTNALNWYFIENTKNKKLPFNDKIFKSMFYTKWLNKEIKIAATI